MEGSRGSFMDNGLINELVSTYGPSPHWVLAYFWSPRPANGEFERLVVFSGSFSIWEIVGTH